MIALILRARLEWVHVRQLKLEGGWLYRPHWKRFVKIKLQAYGTQPSLCNTAVPTLLSETVQKQCKLAEAQARTWNLDFKKPRLLQFKALPQRTNTWVVAALLTTETWHVMVSPARYTGPVTSWHDTSIFWNCDELWQITWKRIT